MIMTQKLANTSNTYKSSGKENSCDKTNAEVKAAADIITYPLYNDRRFVDEISCPT